MPLAEYAFGILHDSAGRATRNRQIAVSGQCRRELRFPTTNGSRFGDRSYHKRSRFGVPSYLSKCPVNSKVHYKSGLQSPPTRGYILKLTLMGRATRNPTCFVLSVLMSGVASSTRPTNPGRRGYKTRLLTTISRKPIAYLLEIYCFSSPIPSKYLPTIRYTIIAVSDQPSALFRRSGRAKRHPTNRVR